MKRMEHWMLMPEKYWMQLRERAGVSTDIDATIAATDLSKEKGFRGCIQGLPWWM